MTVEDRIRKLRIKQAVILAICAFTAYLIFGNPTTSAWFNSNIAPHLGKVLATVFQVAMGFFYMIFQFIGLMYFLAGARCEVVLPGDAQSVTLEDDFWGLPELKKRAQSMVLVLQGHTNLVEMGGEPATGILLSGPPGTGKCVAGDTLVVTEAGMLPISALHPGRRRDSAYNFGLSVATGRGGVEDTSLFYSGGFADTVRLVTGRGFSIECTPEHPLMVMESSGHAVWKRADAIGPGDHVGLSRGDDLWGNSHLDVDTAYFLGVMTGDGSLRMANGIAFSSADDELAEAFRHFCDARGWHTYPNGEYDWHCGRRDAQDWCAEMGLSRGKSHTKLVPECVLRAPREAVVAFLQGYFDTDGGSGERNGYIELGSVSLRLLQQTQALLLNLGIVAAVGKKAGRYNGKKHVSWRLTITGRDARLFYEYVGFRLPRKQSGVELLPEKHNTNFDVVPYAAKRVRLRGTSHRREYEEATKHPSYTTFLSRLPDEGVPADLMWVLKTQPLWDRVKTIEAGHAQVFDLTVPETHSFVANGFISHNTYLARTMAGSAGVPFMLMEAGTLSCVAEGTEVLTRRGPIPIEAVLPGDEVDTGWGVGTVLVTQGKVAEPTLEIVTREGYSLRCLPSHPLWVGQKWVRSHGAKKPGHWARGCGPQWVDAGNIEPGQWVALRAGNSAWPQTCSVDTDTAYFLGLLVGDGWTPAGYRGNRYSACVGNDSEEIRRWIIEYAKSQGLGATVYSRKVGIHSIEFVRHLAGLGIDPELKAPNKVVPASVRHGTKEVVAAFLRGLFDADGSITTWGHITYSSRSKQLVQRVHSMLLQMGIVSTMQETVTRGFKSGKPIYKLLITGECAERFYQDIGFLIPHKRDGALRLPSQYKPKYRLDDGMAWCRVETVREAESANIYDLTVTPTPSYIAGGFVAHNSMWMGVGSIMVRRKGAQAKKLAKRYGACVWVLDEIDSIASTRGGFGMGIGGGGMGMGMGAMAKNALFAVMDGLANPPGIMGWLMRKLYGMAGMKLPPTDYTVLVMGTTNRPAVLDPALLRAGRMDIKWQINPPRTDKGLAEIISYYLGMVKHEDDFGPDDLVNIFRGSTPADIKVTIKRIATSTAVREGADRVSRQHVEMALIEALLGLEDPLDDPFEEDLAHTAYHEAGHLIAVLALYNRENELVPAFATIVPHTGTGQLGRVLGVVVPRLVRPRDSVPMHFFERSVMVSIAGREGEYLGTGQYGMGFGGDRNNIQRALLALVMNCAIGYPASLLLTPGQQGYSLTSLPKSAQEKLEPWIDAFVARTRALLLANRGAHQALTALLLEHGTITAVQLEQFAADYPLVVPPEVEALWAKKEVVDVAG